MRLFTSCSVCMMDITTDPSVMFVSPSNDGRYTYTCERGHSGLTVLQQDRFQLLFEVGLHALVDGYPREAVADFASSLERFYEFFFRMHCRASSIERVEEDKTWSSVASQSERQLGLYLASFLSMNRAKAPTLDDKQVNFRNKVVHKGHIPSRDEALAFGKAAASIMLPIMQQLSRTHAETLDAMTFDRLVSASKGESAATLFYPTYLEFSDDRPSETLEAAIDRIAKRTERWRQERRF